MSSPQSDTNNDEIDLLEIIKVVWDKRINIIVITSVAALISIIYAISQPNIYYAEALLAPAGGDGEGSIVANSWSIWRARSISWDFFARGRS